MPGQAVQAGDLILVLDGERAIPALGDSAGVLGAALLE